MALAYSASDAEEDVEQILRDFQCDFMMDSFMNISSFQSTILGNKSSTKRGNEVSNVCRTVLQYCNALLYLRFADSALSCGNAGQVSKICDQHTAICDSSTMKTLSKTEFLSKIPFSINLSDVAKSSVEFQRICASEIDLKQLSKDIERDELVIAGRRIVGCHEKLENTIKIMGNAIDNCLASCFLPALSASLKDRVVLQVLKTATRTNSGGIALHALRYITDQESIMLLPCSTCAGGILIKVSVGKFSHDRGHSVRIIYSGLEVDDDQSSLSWGLRIEIQASTVYEVMPFSDSVIESDSANTKDTVEVTYNNFICLEIDPKADILDNSEVLGGSGFGNKSDPQGQVHFKRFDFPDLEY